MNRTLCWRNLGVGICLGLVSFLSGLQAEVVPSGYEAPEGSCSPDGKYGVTVPILPENGETGDQKNSLIERATGRVLTVIRANTGWDRMNHQSVKDARWSEDGSLLIWEVEGKWFPWALVVLKLNQGEVAWQVDVLKSAQEAILARTKKAAPKEYSRAKKDNEGWGSAYPEGFSVDVAIDDPVKLPLKVRVALTSDPKGMRGDDAVTSHLTAEVTSEGKFVVKDFGLGPGVSEHF